MTTESESAELAAFISYAWNTGYVLAEERDKAYDALDPLTTRLSELQRENERLKERYEEYLPLVEERAAEEEDKRLVLQERLSRLEEALEFYAHPENYGLDEVMRDDGERARTALDSETETG